MKVNWEPVDETAKHYKQAVFSGGDVLQAVNEIRQREGRTKLPSQAVIDVLDAVAEVAKQASQKAEG